MIQPGHATWAGRKRWGTAATLCCAAILAAGCGDARTAGGTGSETTALSARILHDDGRPAAGVLVRLIDVDRWGRRVLSDSAAAVDSAATDSAGRFRFEGIGGGAYAVEVDGSSEALFVTDLPLLSEGTSRTLGDLRLQEVGRISGTVHSSVGRPERILVAGTALSGTVDSTGRFALDAVPPGDHELLVGIVEGQGISWQRAGRVRVEDGIAVTGLALEVAPRRILIDDFDDGDRRSSLARLQRAGNWFYHDDSAYGGTSRLDPVSTETDLGLATTDSSAWAGRSLHARFRIGSTGTTRFSMIGVEISPRAGGSNAPGWADLSRMDSLVFFAKGSGRVRIQFSTRAMARLSGGTVQFESAFVLNGNWTRVAIPRGSIALPSGSDFADASWDGASSEVRSIHFMANADAELWLDDLTLAGVGLESLLGGAR